MTTATYPLTLPADAGTAGQLLTTNGSSVVSWTSYSNRVVQTVSTLVTSVASGTTAFPRDDTIPQNDEGDQYMTLAITPKSTGNLLRIRVLWNGAQITNSGQALSSALFQDSIANALDAQTINMGIDNGQLQLLMEYIMTAGTISSTTFKVRAGSTSLGGTVVFNGRSGTQLFGGTYTSSIIITEYMA